MRVRYIGLDPKCEGRHRYWRELFIGKRFARISWRLDHPGFSLRIERKHSLFTIERERYR